MSIRSVAVLSVAALLAACSASTQLITNNKPSELVKAKSFKVYHEVIPVQAGVVGADSERIDKMVVRLTYVSHLDVWYRFRVFVLQAFDYETQEGLFVAGQGRDNMVSNEDVVIRDTMAQFKKAVSAR